jgi:hypothetical protein
MLVVSEERFVCGFFAIVSGESDKQPLLLDSKNYLAHSEKGLSGLIFLKSVVNVCLRQG